MNHEEWVTWLQEKFKEAKNHPAVTPLDVVIYELAAIRTKVEEMQEEIKKLERRNPRVR